MFDEFHSLNSFIWSWIMTKKKSIEKFGFVCSSFIGLRQENLRNDQFSIYCSDSINDMIIKIENQLCLD